MEGTDIRGCLLPLTAETNGFLNARTVATLPRGAAVINVGRGGQLVEGDLLAALDSGQISGATLDVFQQEPLPADHPFWEHPRVFRSEEHTSELQSLMRISYAVFCLKKKNTNRNTK